MRYVVEVTNISVGLSTAIVSKATPLFEGEWVRKTSEAFKMNY
jgi:hypothetical protein